MIRWSVLHLASRNTAKRVPLKTTTQLPTYLSSRRMFSESRNDLSKHDLSSKAPETHNHFPKIVVGGLALGSVVLAAYYNGFLDSYIRKDQEDCNEHVKVHIDDKNLQKRPEQATQPQANNLSKPIAENSFQDSGISPSIADLGGKDADTDSEINLPQDSIDIVGIVQEKNTVTPSEECIKDNVLSYDQPSSTASNKSTSKLAEESFHLKTKDLKSDEQQYKTSDIDPSFTLPVENLAEVGIKSMPQEQIPHHNIQEVILDGVTKKSRSLLDDYFLGDNIEEFTANSSEGQKKLMNISSMIEDEYEGYILKDGKLVIDFLQAIHAAEKRQADLDSHSFALEKRAMKEKYEMELKDARARELMYAEKEVILDKELNKERAKAAAVQKSLQEKFEEKLKTELEAKDTETELKLENVRDIGKAELAAAISSEKASQIEKMAEANLHINALCMAFYARSEEARQSHSVQKIALGALAFEDALSKGLPIQKEIEALQAYFEGIDNDSLVASVLSSLPEDTQKYGTDTLLQLNHKFDSLKGTLRHFSLIPPGGGGILAHSLARIASWLKVKEVDHLGDGIESLIKRVENLLAQGKLCEAADALENGVQGSQAVDIVDDWVQRARNRAIMEQALTVLRSYATSISVT